MPETLNETPFDAVVFRSSLARPAMKSFDRRSVVDLPISEYFGGIILL